MYQNDNELHRIVFSLFPQELTVTQLELRLKLRDVRSVHRVGTAQKELQVCLAVTSFALVDITVRQPQEITNNIHVQWERTIPGKEKSGRKIALLVRLADFVMVSQFYLQICINRSNLPFVIL